MSDEQAQRLVIGKVVPGPVQKDEVPVLYTHDHKEMYK
jgi:hypothetical protein